MLKLSTQPDMNAEGYRIQRLDQETELITSPPTSNVEPFPVKRWNEPLPIAVEGRPIPHPESKKPESKSLTRFYPPLLFLSTTLTGVFLFLYVTKPVIVKEASPVAQMATESPALVEKTSPVATSVPEELSPWPEAEMLIADQLPGLTPMNFEPVVETELSMLPTTLGVEQIVKVESLNGELEEFTVSLPVLYPENMLSWNEDSIMEARVLASDIESHLEKVREVQSNGVRLLENWNHLVSKSIPKEVLTEEKVLGLSN